MDQLERVNLFYSQLPYDFLKSFVQGLEQLYTRSYDATEDYPFEYQRYLRPHILRADAEVALLTTARVNELKAESQKNTSNDAHAVVLTQDLICTLSHTDGPFTPPRKAAFRISYSQFAQARFQGHGFGRASLPVEAPKEDSRLYIIIAHGPNPLSWRDLGFITANFVSEDGVQYVGKGVNLLAEFGSAWRRRADEEITRPEILPKSREAQDKGAAE